MIRVMPSNMFRNIAAAMLSLALLSGCSTVKNLFDGRGKDKSEDPKPLVQISPTTTVSQLWSASLGKGGKDLGIGLRPAIVDGHVYALGG